MRASASTRAKLLLVLLAVLATASFTAQASASIEDSPPASPYNFDPAPRPGGPAEHITVFNANVIAPWPAPQHDIIAWNEKQDVRLAEQITLDTNGFSRTYNQLGDLDVPAPTLDPGEIVDSHLLHLNNVANDGSARWGCLSFNSNILGVMLRSARLDGSETPADTSTNENRFNATDLGSPQLSYPTFNNPDRGIELQSNSDFIEVRGATEDVCVYYQIFDVADEIRVITEGNASLTLPNAITETVDAQDVCVAAGFSRDGPLADEAVQFSVSGTHSGSGTSFTDAGGQTGEFCYAGTTAGGPPDTINAYLDSDQDGQQETGDPSDSTQVTWTTRATNMSVSCSPNTPSLNSSTSCTATVNDADVGQKSPPQGSVSFSASPSGVGNLSAGTCTLAAIPGDDDSSRCSVGYSPTSASPPQHTITASYAGNATKHSPSGPVNTQITVGGEIKVVKDIIGGTTPYWEENFDGNSVSDLSDLWNTSHATSGRRWCSTASTGWLPLTVSGNWIDAPTTACNGTAALTPPYGSVSVSNGKASLANGTGRAFPYLWSGPPSRGSPFPASGDFTLDVLMKFDQLTQTNSMLFVRDWPNSDPTGNNPPGGGRVFTVAASTNGLLVGLLGGDAAGPLVEIEDPTADHRYRLEYKDGKYSLYVDDELVLGPVQSSVRPNDIWLGNPVFHHWVSTPWSDFTVDQIKVSVPNTSYAQDFEFQPGGGLTHSPFNLDHDDDPTLSNEKVLKDVPPGSNYNVQEVVPTGWDLIADECEGGISVASGELVTCTFINQKRGKLVVTKDALPDDVQDFAFGLRGLTPSFVDDFNGTALDPQNWNTSIATSGVRWCPNAANLLADTGTWAVPPCPQAPGANDAGPWGTITVANGKASLARGAGRAFPYVWHGPPSLPSPFPASGDFVFETRMKWDSTATHGTTFVVNSWPDTTPQGSQSPAQGRILTVHNGSTSAFTLTLLNNPAVTLTAPTAFHKYRLEYINGMYSAYVDGVLKAGPTASATRPNNIWLGQPTFAHWSSGDWFDQTYDYVRVHGSEAPINFQLDDDGDTDPTLEDTREFDLYPRSYSLDEVVPSGWDLETASCDDASPLHAIDISPDETVNCTFTNEKRGEIVVVKDAQPNDPQNFNFSFTPPVGTPTTFTLDDDSDPALSNTRTFTNLEARGGYSVAETAVSGWDASTTCTGGNLPNSITVPPGGTVTCTVTNKKRGTVVIKKDAFPDETTDFTFTAAGGLSPTSFTLDDDTGSVTPTNTRTFTNVVAQNGYTVTEGATVDFIVGASCDDGASATPSVEDTPNRGVTINLDPGETVTCTFVNTGIYPRPGGGTPLRVPLVPAYDACTAPNATHVGPIDKPSCTPPSQESSQLTTGTSGNQLAFAKLEVYCNGGGAGEQPPCTTTAGDQQDVRLTTQTSDVRRRSDGTDYTGKVILQSDLRVTDRRNDPLGAGSGTVQDTPFSIPIDCVATGSAALGANCNLTTTLDTIVPNFAREVRRAVISAFSVKLLDAGADGSIVPLSGTCPYTCGSGDEQVYLRQGIFTP